MTDLTNDDVDGLRPLFLEDMMLDYTLKIADGTGKVQVHICPSMPLDELVRGPAIQIIL